MVNSPIFLRLAGGLGNQLFQVAAASLYSRWLDKGVCIISDGLSSYKSHRKLLYHHVLRPRLANWHLPLRDSLASLVFSRLRLGRLPIPNLTINDGNALTPMECWPKCLPKFMDGYFQGFWTYSLFIEALSNFIIPSFPETLDSLPASGYVAVHIRGSDFLSVKGFDVVGSSFYSHCFDQAVSHGYTRFVVYTDDLDYASSILSVIRFRHCSVSVDVMSSVSVLDDFNGIRWADARIIGNSTFGWWAAALSSGGPTWSTPQFVEKSRKPFILPGEIYVS